MIPIATKTVAGDMSLSITMHETVEPPGPRSVARSRYYWTHAGGGPTSAHFWPPSFDRGGWHLRNAYVTYRLEMLLCSLAALRTLGDQSLQSGDCTGQPPTTSYNVLPVVFMTTPDEFIQWCGIRVLVQE